MDVPPIPGRRDLALQWGPNPFRHTAVIEFTLPRAERVSLCVLDLCGRKVATLLDALAGPGRQPLTWDCRRAASGIYLGRLEVGDEVTTMRMVHFK